MNKGRAQPRPQSGRAAVACVGAAHPARTGAACPAHSPAHAGVARPASPPAGAGSACHAPARRPAGIGRSLPRTQPPRGGGPEVARDQHAGTKAPHTVASVARSLLKNLALVPISNPLLVLGG